MKDYSRIINLPHHVSQSHPQMSVADRAAQFSSFAALKGHGEAIEEAARVTQGKVELTEDEQAELDVKLGILGGVLQQKPQITVTYFKPDEVKSGGSYLKKTGRLAKIDYYRRELVFEDGASVAVDCITELFGEALDRLYDGGNY
ncbi:MAG: YolD-like family protein [Clostridia bacterium]|nr:YolD-like family protein [Clostridia bacterium]